MLKDRLMVQEIIKMNMIEQKNKIFFSRIAKYYDLIFGNWIKKMQVKVIVFANLKRNSKILDAGCGTGNLLAILEEKGYLKLYGIDISEEMLFIAKNKLKYAKLKNLSVENFNFKNSTFNCIFSIDAFHHYFNKDKAMANFYQTLKRGGKLIVADINFGNYLNRIFYKLEPGNNGILSDIEMKNLFKRHNFRRIKQKRVGMFTMATIGIK